MTEVDVVSYLAGWNDAKAGRQYGEGRSAGMAQIHAAHEAEPTSTNEDAWLVPAEHRSYWHCHHCGQRSGDLEMLQYRRADGVPGCSYPDCAACRQMNAERLERLGFFILSGDPRTATSASDPTHVDDGGSGPDVAVNG